MLLLLATEPPPLEGHVTVVVAMAVLTPPVCCRLDTVVMVTVVLDSCELSLTVCLAQ